MRNTLRAQVAARELTRLCGTAHVSILTVETLPFLSLNGVLLLLYCCCVLRVLCVKSPPFWHIINTMPTRVYRTFTNMMQNRKSSQCSLDYMHMLLSDWRLACLL